MVVLQNYHVGRREPRLLVCFCRVGYHVEAPSQYDVDGRSYIQGTYPETRYFYLTLNLFQLYENTLAEARTDRKNNFAIPPHM